MSNKTDLARELTDLCLELRISDSTAGAQFLADKFEVEPWSADFMLILASLHQRITALRKMIDDSELDDDIKLLAFNCLENIRHAFSLNGLVNQWTHSVTTYLSDTYLHPVRMASAYVRPIHGYDSPDEEEIDELLSLIDDLLTWLSEHELAERDFIRSALIEGLSTFKFRAEKVGWFGWPDTLNSLKDVVAAYMALERGAPANNDSPPYDAMIKKVGGLLKTVFEKVSFVKDVHETGDWLLKGYGAFHIINSATPAATKLLTSGIG